MAETSVRFESEIEIRRPVDDVFARLADLPGYEQWMHRTGLFRRCRLSPGPPIRQGVSYVDSTRMGTFEGVVTEFDPPTRIAFSETLRWFGAPMTTARPSYVLTAHDDVTVVHHLAVGELHGWMKLMKPAAGWMAKVERTRTLDSLKRSLESE